MGVIFQAIALPIILWLGAVALAARLAKKRGKSPWAWGTVAALVIYVPIFWDHIPTVLAHKYYCETEADFQIYKTVEQWKTENPEVAKSLSWRSVPVTTTNPDGSRRQVLNERIALDRRTTPTTLLTTQRHQYIFIDVRSREVLAKRVTVSSGYGNPLVGSRDGINAFKFWLSLDPCVTDIESYGTFFAAIHQMGAKR